MAKLLSTTVGLSLLHASAATTLRETLGVYSKTYSRAVPDCDEACRQERGINEIILEKDVRDKAKLTSGCDEFQARCAEPLNCDIDPPRAFEHSLWYTAGIATVEEKPNPRTMCDQMVSYFTFSRYQFVMRCFDVMNLKLDYRADKRGTGQEHPRLRSFASDSVSEQLRTEEGQTYLTEYCFQNKFCDLDANTHHLVDESIDSSAQHCDDRFGDEWKHVPLEAQDNLKLSKMPRVLGLTSCAMGTFWCDVELCRTMICGNPNTAYVREKLGYQYNQSGFGAR